MQLIDAYRQWKNRRALCDELDALGPEGRDVVARDIGMSEDALGRLVSSRLRPTHELPRLMRSLALDPETVERDSPALMRDMIVICSGCTAARRCGRDLARGTAHAGFARYCPNADTLIALREDL